MKDIRMSYPVSKDDPEYPLHKSQWAAAGVDIEHPDYNPNAYNGVWCCGEPYQKHDFRFLGQRGGGSLGGPVKDIFYCTRCLAKREVPA